VLDRAAAERLFSVKLQTAQQLLGTLDDHLSARASSSPAGYPS
jgi:hypothetical protein